MQKSTWLVMMVGLFLAAGLIWTVPGFAEEKGGKGSKDSNFSQGSGGSCGSGAFDTNKNMKSNSQSSAGFKMGGKSQSQVKNQPRGKTNSLTPAKHSSQPQTQTPGGTIVP
jgi:hypothetical protein